MSTFLERIIIEKDELQDKTTKLENFIGEEAFNGLSGIEKMYLKEQLKHMKSYLSILRQRINYYSK